MDPALYGHNPEERIVAVQQLGDGLMRVYARAGGSVVRRDDEFYPFFFLADASYLSGFSEKHWIRELDGKNFYRYLCAFTRWADMWSAVHFIIARYAAERGEKVESYSELDLIHVRTDPVSQFLIQSGKTLFKQMKFEDLHRLQLDIETTSPRGLNYGNPNRREDRMFLIALSDNRGWEYVIDARKYNEKEMLEEFVRIIRERDPDVIEGHNIYNADLPYLLGRCEMHNVECNVGRDGSSPRSLDSRSGFSERPPDHSFYEIAGRHIIDTRQLAQSHDSSKRSLERYGLGHVAQQFGLAKPGRVYVKQDRISWYWENELDLLIRYALDNAHETRFVSDYLSPNIFYLSQIVPCNYGTLARLGASSRIESILLREYVRQKHSIPKPQSGTQTTGGYADIFHTGVLGPILHVDVESMYPSIMTTGKIAPATDSLGVFLHVLENLLTMRLDAKKRMKAEKNDVEKAKWDAMQSSYKILINSFYGYLGYGRALFNDYIAADRITQTGQKLLVQLINAISENGGTVVEVDTDGILFVPPATLKTERAEQAFTRRVSKVLPEGINLSIDGRYEKMLSYKKKNYALLGYDDKIRIRGSSLISRNLETFGRRYIADSIQALLKNDINRLHEIYVNLRTDISQRKLTVAEFARTEALKDGISQYSKEVADEKRNRMASYEVAIASNLRWKPGDRISFYITGNEATVKGFENCKLSDEWDPNFPDENVPYYLRRLDEFAKKFEGFFEPQDFHAIFSVDDLFEFSAQGISVRTATVPQEPQHVGDEESDSVQVDPKIWLDEG